LPIFCQFFANFLPIFCHFFRRKYLKNHYIGSWERFLKNSVRFAQDVFFNNWATQHRNVRLRSNLELRLN
jgi:hypothetical protein